MALSCGKISANLTLATCGISTPAVKGKVYFLNFDDVDFEGSTKTDGVVSAIVTKNSAKGFMWETYDKGVEVNSPLVAGTYYNAFEHNVVFRVFDKSQTIKDELNALAQGRVVAVVENRSSDNADTHFEIYGWEGGLIMTALDAPSTDGDGVIYTVTLNSDEGSREATLPLSFNAGTIAQSEAALAALIA